MARQHARIADGHGSLAGAVRVVPALAYGTAAAVGVYVAVVVLLAVEMGTLAGGAGGVGTRSFLFGTLGDAYVAHLGVGTDITPGVRGVGLGPTAYLLVPPAVLLFWGAQSARVAAGTDESGTPSPVYRSVAAGASVALGYCLVVGTGVVVLGVAVGFSLVALDPLRAVLVAGVVYPLVFGGVGGYVGRHLG